MAAITCAGKPAASALAAKLFDPPVAMRHPSRRANAPMSEMYLGGYAPASSPHSITSWVSDAGWSHQ